MTRKTTADEVVVVATFHCVVRALLSRCGGKEFLKTTYNGERIIVAVVVSLFKTLLRKVNCRFHDGRSRWEMKIIIVHPPPPPPHSSIHDGRSRWKMKIIYSVWFTSRFENFVVGCPLQIGDSHRPLSFLRSLSSEYIVSRSRG